MRKTLLSAALFLAFVAGTSAITVTPTAHLNHSDQAGNPTVYVCKTGDVYHIDKSCKLLANCKSGVDAVSKMKAVSMKRTACKVCTKKK